MTVQRSRNIFTLADTGYLTNTVSEPVETDGPMSYDWMGRGDGSGILTVHGTDHYTGLLLNAFQHHPALRHCTRSVGVDKGQLEIGDSHPPN